MSMLDIFNKGVGGGAFRAAKCKTLLKLTIPRIKLLRNRREIQLKQMRRDIAKLLENGQEATARIRVEHIIREENMMAAQEIVELFCELIAVRLPIIEAQRECPLDLKEAISSICFAAPRCADLPELQQVQMLFAAKYGKEFVAGATELMPGCGVNRQIIELLSVRAPPVDVKLKLLKEIAEEHELDWDPSATEAEFFKPHEDLLNGLNQHFITMQPIPEKKLDDTDSSAHVDERHYESESDAGSDSLDLPEVPKDTVRPATGVPSAPNFGTHLGPSTDVLRPDHEVKKSTSSTSDEDMPHIPMKPGIVGHDPSVPLVFSASGSKQFVPFANPPPYFTESESQTKFTPPSFSTVSDGTETPISSDQAPPPLPSGLVSSLSTHPTSPPSVSHNEPVPEFSHPAIPSRQVKENASPFSSTSASAADTNNSHSLSSSPLIKSEIEVDLQDVLAAAHAAAETAERAATAARAAASLAQIRITDLVSRRNKQASEKSASEIHEVAYQQNTSGEQKFDRLNSFGSNFENSFASEIKPNLSSPILSSPEAERSPNQTAHVPQRLPSLEDDPYDSYPNLFSSKDPSFKPGDSEN